MTSQKPVQLHHLPSIDRLLRLQEGVPHQLAAKTARLLVERLRQQGKREGGFEAEDVRLCEDGLREGLREIQRELNTPYHRRVLNATGILLHTGLGRAPLCEAAKAALGEVAGQALVEVDPETGGRGRREHAVRDLLCELTGAEDALVVNNNAAATLLGLQVFAQGREVPVSRGELVEIGGGFRMPEVMAQAGCKLVEVGATNRTRLADYEKAIGPETGCLLKVHPSNYRIEGFHQEVALRDLVTLGQKKGVPVFEDLGSGLCLDEALPHDAREPSVQSSVRTGVELCCFSGDKLLGACQAGILVGSKEWVGRVASHPLYRALRQSKLELAALEATLRVYLYGDPKREIPVLRGIFGEVEELEKRAERLKARLEGLPSFTKARLSVVASTAFVGSGSTPARGIESRAVRIEGLKDPQDILRTWRRGSPSLWARIEDGAVLLDLRSLAPNEDHEVGG